jgi:hypothetical protein
MPKMKVLDTRQTSEEVVVMSWSPKMDLLALGNKRGFLFFLRFIIIQLLFDYEVQSLLNVGYHS